MYLGKKWWYDFYRTWFMSWVVILCGIVEALWGYGYLSVKHAMFPLTGSFYNPGPYGGFLAMAFPACLWEVLNRYEFGWKGICYWTGIVGLVLMGIVIPATMSRTAWVAVGISSAFVYVKVYPYMPKIIRRRLSQRCRHWKVIALLLLLAVGTGTYLIKKDSADGRLLMWKVAVQAIAKQPLTGYGWENVPGAYGQAQEEYFASGNYTETEARVAGSPEYVFNEYLQVAMAWGVPALLLLLGLTWWAFHTMKDDWFLTGEAAALLSLMIFSLASYPFQFSLFIVCWGVPVILGLGVYAFDRYRGFKRFDYVRVFFVLALMVFMGSVLYCQHKRNKALEEWEMQRLAFRAGNYREAIELYGKYDAALGGHARYLFEYAQACQKEGQYDLSNQLFHRALQVSSDPMVLNMLGKNAQMEGRYADAEQYFIRSTHRLPNRSYPYYLLVKLYAEKPEGVYDRAKLEQAARMVMEKEPKVQSTAIREMREEVKNLLDEKMTISIK